MKMRNRTNTLKTLPLDKKGQSFLEFLLMMFLVLGLANLLLIGINGGIGKRWKLLIKKIIAPSSTDVRFR